MKYANNLVFWALALILVGAGCGNSTDQTANSNDTNVKPQTQQTATQDVPKTTLNSSQSEDSAMVTTTDTAIAAENQNSKITSSTMTFMVDDTWKTYSNKALSFEFKWPTKGAYAPEWEVTFGKEGDGRINNGCSIDTENISKTTYGEFCHTTSIVDDIEHYRADYYSTKNGNQYIVINFKKNLYTIPDTCKTSGLTVTKDSCKEYVTADYNAQLDTIVSTFKYTE